MNLMINQKVKIKVIQGVKTQVSLKRIHKITSKNSIRHRILVMAEKRTFNRIIIRLKILKINL